MGSWQRDGQTIVDEGPPPWDGPSEPQSHTEHEAALEATLFRKAADPYEVVLELDEGELRLRERERPRD